VKLKGWVRTSLIDFPDHIATILFTGGCNFRCPMCHNPDLVLRAGEMPDLLQKEVWAFLRRRAGLVDGVVITGGEPTIQPNLIPFLRRVRELGLAVKLDTNGYRPDVLAALLNEELLDYVAMDVKAPPDKYPLLTGRADVKPSRVAESVEILTARGLPSEFRTTVVPGLLVEEDIEKIARWLTKAKRYVLQHFRPVNTLDPALEKVTPYQADQLQEMAKRAGRWVAQVTVRGADPHPNPLPGRERE
jgi:pyruvate formate lyase activating enzyme